MSLRLGSLIVALIALLAVTSGYGQETTVRVTGTIPFSFTAGATALPAGQYELVQETGERVIRVLTGGKNVALVPILTRLAASTHSTPQDSHLVFDMVGNEYALSEIWVPDEDGYLLAITKGEHKHKVVNIPH